MFWAHRSLRCRLFHRVAVCFNETPRAKTWKCRAAGCGQMWETTNAPEPRLRPWMWFGGKRSRLSHPGEE
jgi:hypothetical protein